MWRTGEEKGRSEDARASENAHRSNVGRHHHHAVLGGTIKSSDVCDAPSRAARASAWRFSDGRTRRRTGGSPEVHLGPSRLGGLDPSGHSAGHGSDDESMLAGRDGEWEHGREREPAGLDENQVGLSARPLVSAFSAQRGAMADTAVDMRKVFAKPVIKVRAESAHVRLHAPTGTAAGT